MIKIYFLLFIIYSFLGWLFEVIITYNKKEGFVNRGFLLGPYCPIFGVTALIMIVTLSSIKNYFVLFFTAFVIASIVEYITSYLMEKIFKARWWDYSKEFFNLNGRICLGASILFGVFGISLLKIINPFILGNLSKLNINLINYLFYIIFPLFIIDIVISFNVILKVKKTFKFLKSDNTRDITEKVKEALNRKKLTKRFIKAFPNFKVIVKDISKKFSNKK